MKKCMVMYVSSTGNTEQMAAAIAEQARKEGAEVVLCPASALPKAELPTITHWALGCSAHGIEELDGYALRELVSAIYVDAPDKSSGKRVQHIHIKYDGLGFIPLNELMKKETA